jgi:hypothetical protein
LVEVEVYMDSMMVVRLWPFDRGKSVFSFDFISFVIGDDTDTLFCSPI